jgi:hypothetical protein
VKFSTRGSAPADGSYKVAVFEAGMREESSCVPADLFAEDESPTSSNSDEDDENNGGDDAPKYPKTYSAPSPVHGYIYLLATPNGVPACDATTKTSVAKAFSLELNLYGDIKADTETLKTGSAGRVVVSFTKETPGHWKSLVRVRADNKSIKVWERMQASYDRDDAEGKKRVRDTMDYLEKDIKKSEAKAKKKKKRKESEEKNLKDAVEEELAKKDPVEEVKKGWW